MHFTLDPLLNTAQVALLRKELVGPEASWRPGVETAGWHAKGVKNNRQLDRSSELHNRLGATVAEAMLGQPLLQAAALPVRLHGLLFSSTGPGEGYGRHVDNAFMAEGRSDLSFTVFLSGPKDYEGGELVLESPGGEQKVRLLEGHAVVYPSTLLHRVEPVRRGERLVAVGWLQSRIRLSEQRELLFELDTARRSLFAREGISDEFALLSRCYSNLLRMWGE